MVGASATGTGSALGIGLAAATAIVDGALARARELGLPPMTVTVLDLAGLAVAMKREDGSSLLRPAIAHGKAYGALAMGMGSRGLAERAGSHPAFVAALTALTGGNLVPVPGGVLIRDSTGGLLGAVGVSGALPDQDEECAATAITAAAFVPHVGGH